MDAHDGRLWLPAQVGEPGVRRIGLGLAALGRPGYLNLGHGEDLGDRRSVEALRKRTHAVLDTAYEAGMRYFDTARSYGRGEEFLGEWLRDRDPHDAVVGSKWGYVYTAGWEVAADPPEVKHHDRDTFRRQLQETRRHLGDRLALYQIHSATPESGVLTDDDVLADLARLRSEGVAIGVSVSGESQPETIERATRMGAFDAVQATWNLHETSAGDALQEAHDRGMAVIVKEALANGRLTDRAADSQLREAARETGVSADALALAAVLAQPWADIVLSGAATEDTLHSNLRAAEVQWTERMAERFAALSEESSDYWAARSEMAWN
jgi:aryl-alcohol dehydrogenase-like predicted oxidoreductase